MPSLRSTRSGVRTAACIPASCFATSAPSDGMGTATTHPVLLRIKPNDADLVQSRPRGSLPRPDEPCWPGRSADKLRSTVLPISRCDHKVYTSARAAYLFFHIPTELALRDRPRTGIAWLHEVKVDGYRGQLHKPARTSSPSLKKRATASRNSLCWRATFSSSRWHAIFLRSTGRATKVGVLLLTARGSSTRNRRDTRRDRLLRAGCIHLPASTPTMALGGRQDRRRAQQGNGLEQSYGPTDRNACALRR